MFKNGHCFLLFLLIITGALYAIQCDSVQSEVSSHKSKEPDHKQKHIPPHDCKSNTGFKAWTDFQLYKGAAISVHLKCLKTRYYLQNRDANALNQGLIQTFEVSLHRAVLRLCNTLQTAFGFADHVCCKGPAPPRRELRAGELRELLCLRTAFSQAFNVFSSLLPFNQAVVCC